MGDEFSELLGQLKQRSGLSYGVLGKRLHMSASTLHRYVNGDAVPTDYAPVERLARVCKATPDELVELHRRWVLADARRGQKGAMGVGSAEAEPGASAVTEQVAEPVTKLGVELGAELGIEPVVEPVVGSGAGVDPEAGVVPEVERGVLPEAPVAPAARRRRTVVLAGAAVAAAVVAAALVVNLVPGRGDDDQGRQQSVGAAASESVAASPGDTQGSKGKSASPSASGGGTPTASTSVSAPPSDEAGAARDAADEDGASAPTVATNPYRWEDQCSQHYLVNQKAEQVPPPPNEPEARGWVTALGGVAAGQQMLALTVQGTGKATVVLEALHVRVVTKNAPLAWNDFQMGFGCGGGVDTKSFVVDLDAGSPTVETKAGQRDFPYKVSESDPEVFYIFANSKAHDVSWYLELDWSSGTKKGTVRVDDNGNPFRTSGNVGRPAYAYPLGDSEWWRNEYEPNIKG